MTSATCARVPNAVRDNVFQADSMKENPIRVNTLNPRMDIESAAVFLCSDAASFINGAILVVDGGP